MTFHEKYPLDLSQVVMTPLIVRESVRHLVALPPATMGGLRPLAEYAGFTYGALRTAVSRMKKSGVLEAVEGPGVTRYQLSGLYRTITDHYRDYDDSDGFTVALFSFSTRGDKDRRDLREVLKAYGFQKLTRNGYITGRMDTSRFLAELAQRELEKNVFVFECDPVRSPSMLARIKLLWDLPHWEAVAAAFLEDLKRYFEPPVRDDEDAYNRALYVGPAFFKYVQQEFPRLSEAHFPGRALYREAQALMGQFSTTHGPAIKRYYCHINGAPEYPCAPWSPNPSRGEHTSSRGEK